MNEDEHETLQKIKNLPMEKKMTMLSGSDKEYINGFIDCLLLEQTKVKRKNSRADHGEQRKSCPSK